MNDLPLCGACGVAKGVIADEASRRLGLGWCLPCFHASQAFAHCPVCKHKHTYLVCIGAATQQMPVLCSECVQMRCQAP